MNHKTTSVYRLGEIKQLCNEYILEIAYSVFDTMYNGEPFYDIHVRYIVKEGEFGYASMGQFFFHNDCMYVLTDDEGLVDRNELSALQAVLPNVDVANELQGVCVVKVIFAGVRTPYKDNLGDWIYTGDVVRASGHVVAGVCAFPFYCSEYENQPPARYALMLDNHVLPLEECAELERMGTVFFAIDEGVDEVDFEVMMCGLAQRAGYNEDFLFCAQYTPSFYQEMWKYKGLETLKIEYGWRR